MPGILNSYFAGSGGGGGGGPLSVYITPFFNPVETYNPNPSGNDNVELYAIVFGGTPPYAYQWARTTAPDGITPGVTTGSSVTLNAVGDGSPVNSDEETWEVEVMDAAMTVVTDSRDVKFYFGLLPP